MNAFLPTTDTRKHSTEASRVCKQGFSPCWNAPLSQTTIMQFCEDLLGQEDLPIPQAKHCSPSYRHATYTRKTLHIHTQNWPSITFRVLRSQRHTRTRICVHLTESERLCPSNSSWQAWIKTPIMGNELGVDDYTRDWMEWQVEYSTKAPPSASCHDYSSGTQKSRLFVS